jgi:hypothetical protein
MSTLVEFDFLKSTKLDLKYGRIRPKSTSFYEIPLVGIDHIDQENEMKFNKKKWQFFDQI